MPHKTKIILLTNFNQQNFIVDITTTIDLKIKALEQHRSQIDNIDQVSVWLKANAATIGQNIGVDFAEGFIKIELRN